MHNTKFTIITAVYNGASYIEKCIKSIINNGYDLKNVEHIIVDDGSTDDTKTICKNWESKYPHIKFYSKQNGNWGSVMNYVKNNKLIHGEYVATCDADDFLLPGALKMIDEKIYMKDGSKPDVFLTAFKRWNGKHLWVKILPYFFLFKREMTKKRWTQYYDALMVPQSTYIKAEIFNNTPDLKEGVSYQDTILFSDMFKQVKTIKYFNKSCSVYWYQRPGNTMSQNKIEKGLKLWIDNLKILNERDYLEVFFYYTLGKKAIRKYLRKNKIKFQFKKRKLDLSGFPFYVRWLLWITYAIYTKPFIEWKK